MNKKEKAMGIVTDNLNDNINKAMDMYPHADGLTLLQKALGMSIDDIAAMMGWDEKKKNQFIDDMLDNMNEIKKQNNLQ